MILQSIWIKKYLRSIIIEENLDSRLLSFHHELWHGPTGAIIARDEFGVEDGDIKCNSLSYDWACGYVTSRKNNLYIRYD